MKGILVIPLTKTPHPSARIGPKKWQDWFRGLVRAVSIANCLPKSELVILSNFQVAGQKHEVESYLEALGEIGVKVETRIVREGYELIEQVRRAFEIASNENKGIVLVSAFLQYPRARWLIWQNRIKYPSVEVVLFAGWGIPRPKEAITDPILTVVFPLIDLFGCRGLFLNAVIRRRQSGRH